MLNPEKLKKIIIIGVSLIGSITIFLICYKVFVAGTLVVELKNVSAGYRVDGKTHIYTETNSISSLVPGKHKVYAFGTTATDYFPQTYDVYIGWGKTENLTIELEPTKTNPDIGGDTLDINSDTSRKLINTLPQKTSFGYVYFNYKESQYHVDLTPGHSRDEAISWFKLKGLIIVDNLILWGDYIEESW